MTRTRRSTISLGTNFLYTGLTLAFSIFSTPLLLRWLGQERFGTFRALQDWWGYATIFEYGIGGALMARFAMAAGKSDTDMIRKLIAVGLSFYLRATFAILAVSLVWIYALPWLVTVTNITPNELRIAALMLAVAGIVMPLTVFRWLAEAQQRSYVVNLLLVIQSFSMISLLLIMARFDGGLIGQSIAFTLATVIMPGYLLYETLKRYPGVLSEPVDKETSQELWSLNLPTFVFNLSGKISLSMDNILVAWSIGAWAVAPFYLTQRLASISLTQLQGIGNATWAGLVELHMQGESETFRRRLLELTNLVSSISICVLVPIASFNKVFILLWVGQENFAGDSVSLLCCFNVWLWAIYSLWGWPVSGTGNIRQWVNYGVLAMAINIIVSILGVRKFGLIGPLLGTASGFVLIYSWSLPLVINKLFQVSPTALWKAVSAPLLWGIPYAVLVWMISRSYMPQNWLELFVGTGLIFIIGLGIWWTVGLNREIRSLWSMRLRLALGR
ncbi:MAG TPA: oligosaccharide flippase family protein [Blastocatellia bacterium]|nr:oligosaccharide flippase family protein [Blastocatellia bacterium]